jgi:hypothetical protein
MLGQISHSIGHRISDTKKAFLQKVVKEVKLMPKRRGLHIWSLCLKSEGYIRRVAMD